MASNKKKIRKLFLKALSPLEMGKRSQTIDNIKIQEITPCRMTTQFHLIQELMMNL
jgi:hypothetical protein